MSRPHGRIFISHRTTTKALSGLTFSLLVVALICTTVPFSRALAAPIVSDDFNDNSLDTAKWDTNLFSGFTNTSLTLAETSQRLEIGPLVQNISGSSYRGVATVNSYSFTDSYSYVELVQAAASNTAADAMFTIGYDVDNYYRIYVSAGNLIGIKKIAGTKTTLFTTTYNTTNHRFLRIRNDSGNVTLDTAPGTSGVPGSWTQQYSEAWNSSVPTSTIFFELKGGTWQTEANAPGKVIFDNFQAATTSTQSTPPSSYNANTSRTSFTEPALTGSLDLTTSTHQAGYSFSDPTFGSTITRITDASTDTSTSGRNFSPPDSGEVSSWNVDSTKFYVMDLHGGAYYPFSWNGTSAGRLGSSSLSTGGITLTGLLTGGAALPSWSGKDAQIMWGTLDFKLRKLDFTNVNSSSTTVPFTEILNYATVYNTVTGNTLTGTVCSLGVSGVDAANDFIATAINGGQDTWTWAVWYNAATGGYKILDTSTTPLRWWNSATSSWTNITGTTGGWEMHNVKMDRSGRYVLITIVTGSGSTGTGNGYLASWDTTNNTISFTPTAYDGGHRSGGYGYMVNQYANGTDSTQWLLRPASNLATSPTLLVDPYLSASTSSPQYTAMNPDFDEHSSWHTARNGTLYPVFSSTSRDVPVDGSHPWRPYDNEIVAIKTSVPGTIWRLAHHNSTRMSGGNRAVGYYDYSFGQVSPDGRYFLFSSNWRLTLHHSTGLDPNTGTNCAPNCYRVDTFVLTLP